MVVNCNNLFAQLGSVMLIEQNFVYFKLMTKYNFNRRDQNAVRCLKISYEGLVLTMKVFLQTFLTFLNCKIKGMIVSSCALKCVQFLIIDSACSFYGEQGNPFPSWPCSLLTVLQNCSSLWFHMYNGLPQAIDVTDFTVLPLFLLQEWNGNRNSAV